MTNKKTITIISVIVLALLIVFLIVQLTGQSIKQETIKIGVIGPLTGDAAEYGQNTKNAIDLALKEINSKGINGKQVELIYEDSGCNPSQGISALQKLMNVNKVQFFIDEACSSVALAEAPIVEQNKVLLMLSTASNYKIKDAGDYVFRVYSSDALQGKVLAKLINKEGHKKVAVIYLNTDYGVGLEQVFREEFEQLGGSVVISETNSREETDFRSILTKIKSSDADSILLADHPQQGGFILKQMREMGINLPVYGSDAVKDELVLTEAENAAENLIVVFPKAPTGNKLEEFNIEYEQTYGRKPEGYVIYGYDSLMVLANAIEKVGTNPEKVKAELYKTKDYNGATGLITFDENGERTDMSYDTFIVKDKQFIPY
jgi:branched-chain amino acid transport system substrate-binding protein